MNKTTNEITKQRQYYAETSDLYDSMHVNEQGEHSFALCFLIAALDYLQVRSILDIGSGTGRALLYIKTLQPSVRLVGVEPVKELCEVGHTKGLSQKELICGDATDLKFSSEEFDLVCAFGALHHIRRSEKAVSEMIRVAKKAIFISDCNNFGQGSPIIRAVKRVINYFGMWKIADLIKTRGKGYTISEGDGLAYSYSVFNNYKQIRESCESIHLFNTKDAGVNFYKTASHVVLLGIKNKPT